MVLDCERQASVRDASGLARERLARVGQHLVPSSSPTGTRAFEYRRQVKAQDPGADTGATPNRLFERFTGLVRKPETADWLKTVQLLTQAGELMVSERSQPPMIELDRAKARLANKLDETFQADGIGVGPWRPSGVQADGVRQAVGIKGKEQNVWFAGSRGRGVEVGLSRGNEPLESAMVASGHVRPANPRTPEPANRDQ
jgi:hypothetical protein